MSRLAFAVVPLTCFGLLGLTACAPAGGCQPQISSAQVSLEGDAVELTADPATCPVDFTDQQDLLLRLGSGSDPASSRLSFTARVRAQSDGSFKTTVALPPSLPPGRAYATVLGGYDPHASADVNLNVIHFEVPTR